MFAFVRTRRLTESMYVSQSLATSYSLSRESIKFAENSASPEVDFEPKSGKTSFLEFSRKEAVFGKTNYSLSGCLFRVINKQKLSEIEILNLCR